MFEQVADWKVSSFCMCCVYGVVCVCAWGCVYKESDLKPPVLQMGSWAPADCQVLLSFVKPWIKTARRASVVANVVICPCHMRVCVHTRWQYLWHAGLLTEIYTVRGGDGHTKLQWRGFTEHQGRWMSLNQTGGEKWTKTLRESTILYWCCPKKKMPTRY